MAAVVIVEVQPGGEGGDALGLGAAEAEAHDSRNQGCEQVSAGHTADGL